LFFMLDFCLANRNLLIYSILRSFYIRRTFWLRLRAKLEAAPGSFVVNLKKQTKIMQKTGEKESKSGVNSC